MKKKLLKPILLVEDDENDADLVRLALDEAKIANEIIWKRNGLEAWYFLEEAERCPLVAMVDLKMPKMSGIELLEKIRTSPKFESMPVVMLTSSDQDSDLNEAYRLRVNAYIIKPIEFDNFSSAIQTLGLFWAVLNKVPDL